jgi:hypothetical protein
MGVDMRARMWLCLMGLTFAFPATASAESGTSSTVPPLSVAEGKASVTAVLREKFGRRFTDRLGFKRDCYRLMTSTVRCRVRWDHGQWRYSGTVDMKNDPDDPENSMLYRTAIHRTRLGPPAPAPSPTCDSSYKGACLKPNVSDYDCGGGSGDGPYYVQGPITVVGDDHYDLDRDGDGVACES